MKKLLVNRPFLSLLLLGTMVVAMGALFGNPYMSWYHNITVYTNAYVAKTNFTGEVIVTNGLTLGGVRYTNWSSGSGSTNAAWWTAIGNDTVKTNASGKVGIGTNAPSVALEVVGDVKASGGLTLAGGTVNTNTPFAKGLHDAPDAATAKNVLNVGTVMQPLSDSAGTVTANLATNGVYAVTADKDLTFAGSGMAAGSVVRAEITADGSNRALAFDANWLWMTPKPATITANTIGYLTLYCRTNTAASVRAWYSPQIP